MPAQKYATSFQNYLSPQNTALVLGSRLELLIGWELESLVDIVGVSFAFVKNNRS